MRIKLSNRESKIQAEHAYIRGIECLNAVVVTAGTRLGQFPPKVTSWELVTHANLMCLIASSSGRTHSCHSGEP